MTAAMNLGVASVLALMALAGCTGSFDIDQTEPFRVQLDGAPQTVVVREGAEPREVNVQTCPDTTDPCDVEDVEVKFDVTRTSTEACSIKVIIKTVSGEVLGERIIQVGQASGSDGSASGNATGNGTGNATATGSVPDGGSGDTAVQNIVVNVKGNKNIIVVTQALQGDANVNVQAIKASGHSNVDADQDAGSTTTVTASTTNSTSPY
ncbi:MAG TPA: hypothetical protein VM327_02675 [Candidatus Thermoplasmatota archaeon]|nr:hypothetical protein [Candidatus Thermoplasmatota archaeon]